MDILQSIYNRLFEIRMASRKDIVAYADDADSAQVIAQNIRDNIEFYDHIDTGAMINSIKATKRGSQHVVTAIDYAKYVNARSGFIDEAVNEAILDGYDGELALAKDSYNDYPESASNAAKRALKWKEEKGSSCGTPVGWARANQLANKENISRDTIARMASFARHLQYEDVPYSEGCGGIMVDAWGGRSGIEWAQRKLEQIDKKK